jgi:hypothetical protein
MPPSVDTPELAAAAIPMAMDNPGVDAQLTAVKRECAAATSRSAHHKRASVPTSVRRKALAVLRVSAHDVSVRDGTTHEGRGIVRVPPQLAAIVVLECRS